MKKLAYIIILISQLLTAAWAQSFVVRNIEVEGLQRVTPATVESYMPIKRGQVLQPSKTSAILRSLYQTGFFEHITLSREGNTLVVHVVERPTIGQLKIVGNSVIPTDKLTSVMKSLDIAEGRVYNPVMLEKIRQSLLNEYYQLGRYNARVDVNTAPMPRNRVMVTINISEGLVAKIQRISIMGNHIYDEDTLVKQLDISTTGLFSFISQSDRYSEEKLEASMEKLRAYYMDRGYIRFEIRSAQAEITPDRKSIYVTIIVNEGSQYTVKDVVVNGNTVLSHADIIKLINVKPGETFNRKKILDGEKAVSKALGDQGYLFANISLHPNVNDAARDVILVFNINPGKRVYVHHINFNDNNRTNDEVLRREVLQAESSPASSTRIEESKQRLSLLPFIKNVETSVKPVPNANDQVDVNYKVTEDNSAQASFKLGYSMIYRTILGVGLNQKNFFGTGDTLGINLQRSKFEQFYGIDFTDPYYTIDGISRSFSMSVSRVDPGTAGTTSYTTHEYDAGVMYGIPIGQDTTIINRLLLGVAYQDTIVYLPGGSINPLRIPVSNQVSSFVNAHGRHFQELDLKAGYARDSRDRAIFPTRGGAESIYVDVFAPVAKSSISFYTLNFHGKWYQPIYDQFIGLARTDLSYGNGFHGISDYPFFRNYYAGGIDSVRGYEGYSLGPLDSKGRAYGGNILIDGSVSLIFPNYLTDSLRTSVFVDGGNVYHTGNNKNFGCTTDSTGTSCSTNSGPLRFSAGLEADWLTPFGPIELSLAKPINRRKGDEQESFQFALGANF